MSSLSVLDVDILLESLAKKRPVFHSECDFQFALAWEIQVQYPKARLRLERPVPDSKPLEYTDLLVYYDRETVAFELKYKLPGGPKKRVLHEDEWFSVAGQGAPLYGRYDCVKDIWRLERLVAAGHATAGIAILLTNYKSYWNSNPKEAQKDRAFHIHDGRELKGALDWPMEAKSSAKRPPFSLLGRYPCRWKNYSRIPGGDFRALITHVYSASLSERISPCLNQARSPVE